MKFTKLALKVMAVVAFLIVVTPQYAYAASSATVENSYIVNAPSVHADQYDELVNVANNSAGGNPSTWNPTYQGIWVGGSTKESLFQFNEVTAASSCMLLTWEVQFTPSQIMSGASDFVVRLPYYSDPVAINSATFYIFQINESNAYSFSANQAGNTIDIAFTTGAYRTYISATIDPADAAPMDGDDFWTVDYRQYVQVRAPIEPGKLYLFGVWIRYDANANFKVYLSPNDVASDGYVNAHVSKYIPTTPITNQFSSTNYTIDLGASYDFRQGMGGKFVSRQFYMGAGSYLAFYAYSGGARNLNGYHSIMIPFITANGSGNFTVRAYPCSDLLTEAIEVNATTYYGYILACDPSPYNASTSSPDGDIYNIRVTATYAQLVTFLFQDIEQTDLHPSFGAHGYGDHNDTEQITVAGKGLYFKLYNVYMVTSNYLEVPSPGSVTVPVEPTQNFARGLNWGSLLIGVLFGPWASITYELTTYQVNSVAPGLINSAITDVMGAGITTIVFGSPVYWFLYNGVLGQGGLAQYFGLPDISIVPTFFTNILDGVWDALIGVGQFLWSIGEQIWAALTWLANAIAEYGAILLGLLIIGVALLLFFYPIQYEVRILESLKLMAQGRIAEGANRGMAVGKDIVDDFRPSKKVEKKLTSFLRGSKK